jgi:hypothetical protein
MVTVNRRNAGGRTEVLKLTGFLRDHGWAHTLTIEPACVVRFMFVGGSFNCDVIDKPPQKVPKLKDVLNFHAKEGEKT